MAMKYFKEFFGKYKSLIFNSKEFFASLKEEPLNETLWFCAPVILILYLIHFANTLIFLPEVFGLEFLFIAVLTAIASYGIVPIIIHKIISFLGGKGTWKQTIQAFLYYKAATALIGIPYSFFTSYSMGQAYQNMFTYVMDPSLKQVFLSVAIIVMGIYLLLMYLFLVGLSTIHKIRKFRILAAIIVAELVLIVITIIISMLWFLYQLQTNQLPDDILREINELNKL